MYIDKERRGFIRVRGEVGIRYSPQGSSREYFATTRNISGSGMKVLLLKRLRPGTVLDLEIFRSNADVSARCKGEIVWIRVAPAGLNGKQGFEAGLKFINSNLFFIANLINDLQTQRLRYAYSTS